MIRTGPRRYRLLLASCTALTALAPLALSANPQGGTVVAGQASIETPSQGHLVVRQGSARAVIDWQSFSIGAGEHTQFIQPSGSAVALNRVTGPDPSVIAGRLSANGRIVIQNEAGVTFSEGAQVNASSLLATTSRVDAGRLMATGEVAADRPGRVAGARVENRGEITVADSGVAALVGPEVRNSGRIVARQGRVVLGGAETYTIDLAGDGLVAFAVRDPVTRAPSDGGAVVANTGTIEAPGGQVVVSARAARGVVDDVIFAGGRIAATAVHQQGGAIVLGGGDAGTVTVAGNLDVSAQGAGQRGGTIDVRGERIAVRSTARLDASGRAGGGAVRVGGDLRGRGPGPTARSVVVEPGAAILADATGRGDGGTAIVWSDEVTRFWGQISARGGPEGGDGGFAEVSSKGWLDYRGMADLRATLGKAGVLLLDPADLRIAAGGDETVAIDGTPPDPVVITPAPAGDPPAVSVLRTATLQDQLALADVVVSTLGSPDIPGQSGRIDIIDGFAIPDGRTLTLEAAGAIAQAAAATITGTGAATLAMQSGLAGAGDITLAGTLNLGAAGRLLLDATGGGTGAGGGIGQTGGTITAGAVLARAADGVAIASAAIGTVAGSAGGPFSLSGAGGLTVGSVAGVAGIATTGTPITLAVAGALSLEQALAAPGSTVTLTTTAAGTIGQGAAGAITADRLAIQSAGAVTLEAAANQVGGLAAIAAGGLAVRTATAAEVAARNTGSGALALTGEAGLTVVADAALALAGVQNTAGGVALTAGGDLAVTAPLAAAAGATVALAAGGSVGQTAAGSITASRLAIETGGPAALDAAPNQVATLAATTAGGLAFRTQAAATIAARNAGAGAIAITGQGNLTVGTDAPLALAGVQNLAGAVTLEAANTLAVGVGAPVAAATLASLRGAAVTVNGTVAAPRVEAVADTLAVGVAGALGTDALTQAVLRTRTAGRPISLGGTAANTLSLTAATLERIGIGAGSFHLRVGSAGEPLRAGEAPTGTLTIRAPTDLAGRRVTLEAGSAGAAVTQLAGAALTADSLVARAAQGAVLLGLAANQVGAFAGAAPGASADVAFLGAGTVRLDALTHGTDATVHGVTAGRTVRLASESGGVEQTTAGRIEAQGLLARAIFGTVDLTASAANAVGTIAGEGWLGFHYRGAGDVTVGAVAAGAGFGAANGIATTLPGMPVTLLAAGDLALATPVTAADGIARLSAGQDLTQTEAGTITAGALLARAGRDALLDGADGTRPPGTPGGPAGNAVGTVAAVAGRELWYRSAGDVVVGAVAGSALVAGATGASAGGDGVARLAVAAGGGTLTVEAPVAGRGVELAADRLSLDATVGAAAEAVVVRPFTAGRAIELGNLFPFAPDTLWLSPGAIDLLGGADTVLRIGSVGTAGEAAAGAIAVRANLFAPGTGIAVNRTAGETRTLVLESGAGGTAIGQDGPITGGAAATLVAVAPNGAVELGHAANAVGTLAGAAGAGGFRFRTGGSLTVGASDGIALGAEVPLAIAGRDGIAAAGGPVTLLAGGGLALGRPVAAGAGTVRLQAGGALTQGVDGGLTAGALLARGGTVDLTAATNAVGVLAGGAGAGFRFRGAGALTVGSVTDDAVLPVSGMSGVASLDGPAPITLVTEAGDLTLAQAVNAGLGAGGIVRLQAGGTLGQGAGGVVIADQALLRGASVLLDQTNLVGGVAGAAAAQFRFADAAGLTVAEVAGDPLVAGAAGIRLGAGTGTVTLVGGTVSGGGVRLEAPVDAGAGTVRLEAGAAGHVQQTAAGALTAGAVEAVAPTGAVDLATAGAANAVGSITGAGRDGFRFRAEGPLAVGAGGIATQDAPLTVVSAAGLTLAGPLAAGTGTVRLRALGGDIVQTGGTITAGALALAADAGAVAVAEPGNSFGVFAGTALGPLAFEVAGALSIAAIGADGPGESQAGVLDPGAVLVPALAGATSAAAAVQIAADGGLAVPGVVAAGTDAVLTSAQSLTVSGTVSAAADAVLAAGTTLAVVGGGSVEAGGTATLTAGGTLDLAGTVSAGSAATLTAGDLWVAPGGLVRSLGSASLTASGPLAHQGLVETDGAAVLAAGDLLWAAGTVRAGAEATLTSGDETILSGTVEAGTDAVLGADRLLLVGGSVQAGRDAVLASAGGMSVAGSVAAGADALLGSAGAMTVSGEVRAGPGRQAILGFGTDVTLTGQVGAPDGRILLRRAAPAAPGGVGSIALEGGGAQFSLGGTPQMIVIDASGDLRPFGAPDPGTDVGQLRAVLAGLVQQTPADIAVNRIVRLSGFPSFVARVTGSQTRFGTAGADAVQSTVNVSLGAIDAPGTLLYVFGENGWVRSNTAFDNALRVGAVGVYVNETAEVALFGVINGVAGDAASTFVQRLGDPQTRQRINGCTIGLIGCTFLPIAQEPAIAAPPVVLVEAAAPRFDESAVPIVNTGPEDTLRAGEEEDEEPDAGPPRAGQGR